MDADAGLAVIGAGAMGSALLTGMVAGGAVAADRARVYDIVQSVREQVGAATGAAPVPTLADAVRGAHAVLLCVKPGQVAEALKEASAAIEPGQTLISIAAGVSTATLESCLPDGVPVVRAMPNIGSTVAMGATAICGGASARPEHLELARRLLETTGRVWVVPECLMDAVTGLSGSGIAYAFVFIEAMADGGVRAGLPRDVAQAMAAQVVAGAATLVARGDAHPASLKDRVASPAGTTIEGIAALESSGFRGSVIAAVTAAAKRSAELGRA